MSSCTVDCIIDGQQIISKIESEKLGKSWVAQN